MAKKKKSAGNRSQAIRDYLAEHPQATAGEIVPALARQGIEVSAGLVSNVKHAVTHGTKPLVPGRADGRRRRGVSQLSAENLFEAKRLVDELGGIDAARQALEALEKLR